MLDQILRRTSEFLDEMPKSVRKKKGQFFTSRETAAFMASLFDTEDLSGTVTALDPGAGTGILSAALIDRLVSENRVSDIQLVCYENDSDVLPLLRENLEYLKQNSSVKIDYKINEENYILSQSNDFEGTLFAKKNPEKYDLIIGNPPYLRIMRKSEEAESMPTVVHGAPNLYFLFAAMSLFNLKDDAEMVYIIPRSWTSGEYFKAFRNYFLYYGRLMQIHLFVSRDKVFSQESVLQETMIIKVKKTDVTPDKVVISSTQTNNDFDDITSIEVPYDAVVNGDNLYVYLPTNDEDVRVIQVVNTYQKTLPDEGLKMHTGIVVDFRQWNELKKEPGKHTLPLFYSQNIRNGRVNHNPSGKEYDWIVDSVPGLIQKNKNYVFCKRFTAKEEKRRLQCGIYLAHDFPEYRFIGTQNKINYVDRTDKKEMSLPLTYGIFALLNSTLFDKFYRILNGSTQVNSTEINNIPVPPVEDIEEIGEQLIEADDLSTETCDSIMMGVSYNG